MRRFPVLALAVLAIAIAIAVRRSGTGAAVAPTSVHVGAAGEPGEPDRVEPAQSEFGGVRAPAASPAGPLPTAAAAAAGLAFEVVDADERPIAGALVTAVRGALEVAAANTDERGRARLTAVPGDGEFRVRAHGFLEVGGRADPNAAWQRVALAAAPVLRGRVLGPDGGPLAGARALLLPRQPDRRAAPAALPPGCQGADSDAAGGFVLPWPSLSPHDLVVTAKGCAPHVTHALDPIAQGDRVRLVPLLAAAQVAGRALRADGGGLAFARIELWTAAPRAAVAACAVGAFEPWRSGELLATGIADREGAFAIADLPAGMAWVACGAGIGGAALVPLAVGETSAVTLCAPASGEIAGAASGAPAGGRMFLHGDATRFAPIAADGTFRFPGVPPGRYLLGVAQEPLPPRLAAALQQLAAEGVTPFGIVVDLAPGERRIADVPPLPSAVGSIGGSACAAGLPVAGAAVEVLPATGAAPVGRGDVGADGGFRVDGLPPGDYVVRLLRGPGPAAATAACRVHPGSSTIVELNAP